MDIDQESGDYVKRPQYEAPEKKFYQIDLPINPDNQVVPITDLNADWNEINTYVDKEIKSLKWDEAVKNYTKRLSKIDHLGWKKHTKEL